MNFLSMLLHQVYGKIMMLKRESFANFLADAAKTLVDTVVVDKEERLISSFVVIHLPLNLSF
jgi:phenylalanine-4-hydroxylase